jgi:hypothetical protein
MAAIKSTTTTPKSVTETPKPVTTTQAKPAKKAPIQLSKLFKR